MRKLFVLLLVSALIFSGVGCSGNGDNFQEVDDATREGLIALLQSAALGGCGEYVINVDGVIGAGSVGDVSGSVSGNFAAAEMVSLSFLEDKLIEVSREEISPEGKWGPLTMLYGPKALILLEEEVMKGYYIPGPRFAAVLDSATVYSDFLINPQDTGLVALALIHGEKLQAAADLLAGLQTIHPLLSGLPAKADIFGRPLGDDVDYAATAWAGYAAAVLAKTADNQDLWNEARVYASYLEAIAVPEDNESRLAGWLLFHELSQKNPDYAGFAEKWQLEPGETYNPLIGIWMLMTKGKTKKYVDLDYVPISQTDKWIHYNLLASINKLPAELDLTVTDVPGGKAVTEDGKTSLQATSWMVIALHGGLTN